MGLSEKLSTAVDALSRNPLGAIIPKTQNIVYLEHNNTVGTALQLLAKRHILSAPLVIVPGLEDMETEEGGSAAPQLIGWVTVESILRAFLTHLEEKYGKLPRNMLLLMTQLEKEGPAFAEKPLITVSGSEDRGLMFQVLSDVSLLTALRESFVPPGKPAAHRLAVFDATGSITAVVSQLDVIRHLRQHPEVLGDLASVTVEELGWLPPPPAPAPATVSPGRTSLCGRGLVTVEASLPAILAYERMARAGVSGAPVVADAEAAVGSGSGSGGMMANLSMSDLRNIQTQHLGILALPVGEFLALLHNTSYLGYSQRTSAQAAHPFFASGPPSVRMPRATSSPGYSPLGGAAPRPPSRGSGAASPGGGSAAVVATSAAAARRSSASGAGGGTPTPLEAMLEGDGEGDGEGEAAGAPDIGIRMISCTGQTTLAEVLSLLSDNKVHRVYVAAKDSGNGGAGASPPLVRPAGVITPTDILRLLAGTQ